MHIFYKVARAIIPIYRIPIISRTLASYVVIAKLSYRDLATKEIRPITAIIRKQDACTYLSALANLANGYNNSYHHSTNSS